MTTDPVQSAAEALAELRGMGVNLHLNGNRLIALPTDAVTAEVKALVRWNRDAIIELLSAPSPMPQNAPNTGFLFVDGVCVPSPGFCRTCGNPDYYATGTGWHCAFCVPQMIAPLTFSRPPFPMPWPRPEPKMMYGEPVPFVPADSFWDADEIAALWTEGWTPARPAGKSARAVAKMSAADRSEAALRGQRSIDERIRGMAPTTTETTETRGLDR